MRGCLRFIISLFGLVLLIGGVVTLFLARGPQLFTEERTLGGASTTQQQVASEAFGGVYDAQNLPDLPVTIDGQASSTNILNAAPEIEQDALADVSTMDEQEAQAVQDVIINQQETIAEVQTFAVDVQDASIASQSVQTNAVVDEKTEVEVVPLEVSAANIANTTGQGGAGGTTAAVEQRVVELEWAENFRVGGAESVRLTLKTLDGGQLEIVPEFEDNAIIATPILITDRYDTHFANFTVRLVAPDFEVVPVSQETQILERSQEGTWRWSLDVPEETGRYVITIGIDLIWTPRPNSGQAQLAPQTIWGQALKVDVNYVFGSVTVPQASLLGSVLAGLGFISQLPLLGEILSGVWRFMFGGSKKKSQPTQQKRRR